MKESQFTVQTPEDFADGISYILSLSAPDSLFIMLHGDLGAGKTTFTQQLAKQLGIDDPVVSPTFSIMKVYETANHDQFDQLVHIDAYRIEEETELGPLRFAEQFEESRTIFCIEWPDNIASVLPQDRVDVFIQIESDETRTVTVRSDLD